MKLNKNTFLIISGGKINYGFLKQYTEGYTFNKIICVDGGLEAADALNLKVDYIVGDFDSVSREVLHKYKSGINEAEDRAVLLEFAPEKDATDTHIAIDLAINENADGLVIFGATGSRVDHLLANINLLMKPLSFGIQAYIIDENNKIYLVRENAVLKRNELFGKYISLLPLTQRVEGVSLTGFKYPLNHHQLEIGDSLGVSNELIEEEGMVSLESGILIIIESRD